MAVIRTNIQLEAVQWVSDLHLDSNPGYRLAVPDNAARTLLIIPGDIACKRHRERAINLISEAASQYAAVIVVLGNHDHWEASIDLEPALWKAAVPANVFVLSRDTVYFSAINTYIHGCTLWTDANNNDSRLRLILEMKGMDGQPVYKDIKKIRCQRYTQKLGISGIIQAHQKDRAWLREQLETGEGSAEHWVVTHYSPWVAPQLPEHRKTCLDRFWWNCSDMEFVLDLPNVPTHWFHGHTHHKLDYQAGDIRMLCNPSGHAQDHLTPHETPLLTLINKKGS